MVSEVFSEPLAHNEIMRVGVTAACRRLVADEM